MASSNFRLLEANPYFLELPDVVLTITELGYYKQRITHIALFLFISRSKFSFYRVFKCVYTWDFYYQQRSQLGIFVTAIICMNPTLSVPTYYLTV